MTEAEQTKADLRLVKRIDEFGKGLTSAEVVMVESFTRWLEGGRPLTEKQRAVAERIDEQRIR